MSESASNSEKGVSEPQTVRLADIFAIDRIKIDSEAKSQKGLLEQLSYLLSSGHEVKADKDTVYQKICERERLGSTYIKYLDRGVVLPHGRFADLNRPIGAVVRLRRPIKFAKTDDNEISVACGLLVPASDPDTHLYLLGSLAKGFQKGGLLERLEQAETEAQMYEYLAACDVKLEP